MSGLARITGAAPVLSTHHAVALANAAATVVNDYDWHAATYVEQPAIAAFRHAFLEAIRAERSPKAALVAPYGYGKTATAIGLWRACDRAGLLAVPPIACDSFTDLARAVCDWLRHSVPRRVGDIDALYERFLTRSAESLARRDERQFGIPFAQGLAAIRDKLERGYLDFDDVSVNLLDLLVRATELARAAGYSGLVVIVDEMQQLIGKAGKGVVVALRQLIWGLRTHHRALGLLLTLDPDTERTLVDRAGDILHRIKDDGLYLDIRHVYDREFPARLWDQFARALALTPDDLAVISRPALEAIGQICERDDLSDGPRTAIDMLQRAATVGQRQPGSAYGPIDLIDDILSGAITFTGGRAQIAATLADLLRYPYVQRSPERTRSLKLLAAFPRGCPAFVGEAYGLADALTALNDDLRGDIITETDEGLALVALQRVGRPANLLNSLLRRYWMQRTDRDLDAEDAVRIFAEVVLPLVFPARLHDLSGWSVVEPVQLSVDGTYGGLYEGTASPAFPLRRVAVRIVVGHQPLPVEDADDSVDLYLTFRLDLSADASPQLEVHRERGRLTLRLALARPSEEPLAGGLAWIEHYLKPQPISPAEILGLLQYFARERPAEMSDRDRTRFEDVVMRLKVRLLADLFPGGLFAAGGYPVAQAGAEALHECLFLIARQIWPAYRSLIAHRHWCDMAAEYGAALSRVAPAVRVGVAPLQSTKSAVAGIFSQAKHAGFESRARLFGEILRLEHWRGDEATVRFVPHPAELTIARLVRQSGSVARDAAIRTLRTSGFAAREAEILVSLALARGLIQEKGTTLDAPPAPTPAEVEARGRALMARSFAIASDGDDIAALVKSILDDLRRDVDPLELDWRLSGAERQLQSIEADAQAKRRAEVQVIHSELLRVLPQLAALASPRIHGVLANHLAAAYREIETERHQLTTSAEQMVAGIETHSTAEGMALIARADRWIERRELYQRWLWLADGLSSLQAAIARLDGSTGRLAEVAGSVDEFARQARSVLALHGLSGLPQIDRLEIAVSSLRDQYAAASREREAAYRRIAEELALELRDVLELPSVPELFVYSDDEDTGFATLHAAAGTIARRAILLLRLSVVMAGTGKADTLRRARLRADIEATARKATDPAWLIDPGRSRMRAEAIRAIRAIKSRVARETFITGAHGDGIMSELTRMLAAPDEHAVNMADWLQSRTVEGSNGDIMNAILRLSATGLIELKIGLRDIDP